MKRTPSFLFLLAACLVAANIVGCSSPSGQQAATSTDFTKAPGAPPPGMKLAPDGAKAPVTGMAPKSK